MCAVGVNADVVIDESLTTAFTTKGGSYFYRVAAVYGESDSANPGGEGLPGAFFGARVPGGIDGLALLLSWDTLPGAVRYRLYRTATPDLLATELGLLATVDAPDPTVDVVEYIDEGGPLTDPGALPLVDASLGAWSTIDTIPGSGRFGLSSAVANRNQDPTKPVLCALPFYAQVYGHSSAREHAHARTFAGCGLCGSFYDLVSKPIRRDNSIDLFGGSDQSGLVNVGTRIVPGSTGSAVVACAISITPAADGGVREEQSMSACEALTSLPNPIVFGGGNTMTAANSGLSIGSANILLASGGVNPGSTNGGYAGVQNDAITTALSQFQSTGFGQAQGACFASANGFFYTLGGLKPPRKEIDATMSHTNDELNLIFQAESLTGFVGGNTMGSGGKVARIYPACTSLNAFFFIAGGFGKPLQTSLSGNSIQASVEQVPQ